MMFGPVKMTREELVRAKRRFYLSGALFLILGTAAAAMPMVATLAAETMIGFIFLMAAGSQGWSAFSAFKSGDGIGDHLFVAVMSLVAGVMFLFYPKAGVITMSLFLAAYFFLDGLFKIVEFFRFRNELKASIWLLVSGILGIILAFMMWRDKAAGAVIMGIMLAINLLSSGITLIMLARSCSEKTMTCGFPKPGAGSDDGGENEEEDEDGV